MIDSLKKTLLAGLGAAVVSKDKVEAALDDLVRQGKVTSAEAKDIAEKLVAEGRREADALGQEVGEKLKSAFAGIDQRAQQRLDALEARVAALEQAAAAATAQAADTVQPPSRD
ncbi:MAG: phasin family protein [Opitutaceae bacterium]